MLKLAKQVNNFYFGEFSKKTCLPFLCSKYQVGLISSSVLKHLKKYPEVFVISEDNVTLHDKLNTADARNSAIERILLDLKSQDVVPALRGWRYECYEIRPSFSAPVLFKMERSATPLFGVRQYGVHINGYVQDNEKGMSLWIQRRSKNKQTWPGKLDSFVGGGLTEGLGIIETAIKEAGEEANVPVELARNIKPAGSVSFFHQSERGIHPNTEFVFDLELPESFHPSNNDGEVEDWLLVPINEVYGKISDKDNFKITSIPVALDFLVRHGQINVDIERDLPEIVELIHLPLHNLFNHNQ